MAQLILNWKNDGAEAVFPPFPTGVELKTLIEMENATEAWLDIARFVWSGEKLDKQIFNKFILDYPNFNEDTCFFLTVDGVPASIFSIMTDFSAKRGYIHMVSCKPEYRGMGLGTLMNAITVYTLKTLGMETAYLTTDDFRIPAIKSYLRAGFVPDLETEPDFKERWNKIYTELGI